MAGRPGRAAGAFCCAASTWLCVVVLVTLEVVLQLGGLVTEAGLQVSPEPEAGRQLEADGSAVTDHADGEDLRGLRGLRWLSPVLNLAAWIIVAIVSSVGCYCHWTCYIKDTAEKYIPRYAVVPAELTGEFKYELFDCCSERGTCCCFMWCSPCMIGDLWYRIGWVHAVMGYGTSPYDVSCPGWRWCVGVCAYCVVQDVASCCTACVMSALRGGVSFVDGSDGGFGDVIPFRKLFKIEPHLGFNTFCHDCCVWCWCSPCAGTQEYRQVMDLLNRGGIQVSPPQMPQQVIVGQAVGVSPAPVVGQPYDGPQGYGGVK